MTPRNLFTLTEIALFALVCVMLVVLVGCAPEEVTRQARVYGGLAEYEAFIEREEQ